MSILLGIVSLMKQVLFLIFFLLVSQSAATQIRDIVMPTKANKVEIPFDYVNDFIVVNIVFNGILPLKFIFDTGAEHTIITKKEITDILQVDYQKKFTIYGSDLSTELTAYLATKVSFHVNQFNAVNRTVLVLEDDYFNFEEMTGFSIQGIIGSDIFRRFIVKIDYKRQKITLYDPEQFTPPGKKYKKVDLEIHRHKPYLKANATFQNRNNLNAKLLIDTGASLPLLLYTNTDSAISIPPMAVKSKIAMGLGGALEGFLGRTSELLVSSYKLTDVITNFQALLEEVEPQQINFRNGIIGNKLLRRFTIFLDYDNETGYFKANSRFNKKFKYDRSGLLAISSGENLKTLTVSEVLAGSPAEKAGIIAGDEIRRINGVPSLFLTLSDLNRKMRKKVGKKIKIVIRRNGQNIKKEFKLRDLI